MQQTYLSLRFPAFLLAMIVFMASCKKEEYAIPDANTALTNDAIKRTLGPNIVGQNIEFAYAMALPKEKGKLVSATVVASIAGATGTYMDNKSYFTKNNGQDSGIVVGSLSVNSGASTAVQFTRDTMATTFRYFYVIPEEARGKTVSFTFSATSSDGATVSYQMGPYTIAKMDMARNLAVRNGDACYISIADTTVYTTANVAANAGKIDLVYLYRATPTTFLHALVSPGADAIYKPGLTLPAGMTKVSKLRKVFNLQDFNLARLQYGIYIDDLDFQQINLADQPNYALNMKVESGAWVETADGRYRAYIYVNSVNANGSAVISMKRYDMGVK